jgi:hypothetical protein
MIGESRLCAAPSCQQQGPIKRGYGRTDRAANKNNKMRMADKKNKMRMADKNTVKWLYLTLIKGIP